MKYVLILITLLLFLSNITNAQLNDVYLPQKNNVNSVSMVESNLSADKTGWSNFKELNGDWFVTIDKATMTPHMAIGPAIKIEGFNSINETNVYDASLRFLNDNSDVFNINTNNLIPVRATHKKAKWYVSFKQIHNEHEVINSEVELRITDDANVMTFGIDYYNDIDIDLKPQISINEAAAKATGNDIVKNNVTVLNSDEDEKVYILPIKYRSRVTYKPVYKINFKVDNDHRVYMSYVNAKDGTVHYRKSLTNEFASDISVKGDIFETKPQDETVIKNFVNQEIMANGESYITDKTGKISLDLTEPTEITTTFKGPYCNVTFDKGASSIFTTSLDPGNDFEMIWTDENSNKFERFGFYHTNLVHDWIKNIDPELDAVDIQFNVDFQKNSQYGVNAYSNSDTIVFLQYDDESTLIGQSPAVLYHEYGHSINTLFFKDQRGKDMESMASHEGIADLTAALILDSPLVGLGVFADDLEKSIRSLSNNLKYPKDMQGESHHDGQILGGAFWDLRELTSVELTANLSHSARYGLPDDVNDGVAFSEWFVETLVADDDDGDLSNGTPHLTEIVQAFNNHDIGTNLLLNQSFEHTPLENTEHYDIPFEINFTLEVPSIANFSIENVKVVYSTDNFQTRYVISATETSDGEYSAEIPAQESSSFIQYYILFSDNLTDYKYIFPIDDIYYNFMAGYKTVYTEDFESDPEWDMQPEGTTASTGSWEIADPRVVDMSMFGMNVILQPEDDHTEEGSKCLVTDSDVGFMMNFIYHCLAGGQVIAESPSIEIPQNVNSILQFYRWFAYVSQQQEDSEELYFKVEYSVVDDEWNELVKYTQASDNWEKTIVSLPDDTKHSGSLKLRFIAKNPAGGQMPSTIAEALVDDITILSPTSGINSVEESQQDGIVVYPNPFSESVRISQNLMSSENTRIMITDIHGNLVKEYNTTNSIVWDGTDLHGEIVPSGVYFVTLRNGTITESIKLMKSK